MKLTLNLFCILFISCSVRQEIYDVKGTIRSISIEQNRITIAHDSIRDLMMPMVMPFTVLDKKELSQLKIGDSVHFKFIWSDKLPYAKSFNIVGRGHVPEDDDFFDDDFSELKIGEFFDNVTLLDIDSNKINLSDGDGSYRFISYIFTRCPMPNMCPAVIMKTNYLVNSFSDSKLIDFILVSFDYKYDKPSVLKRAYGSYLEGRNNLKIWSSTGKVDDVYRLVKQSGGDFWGVEENKIGHTLRSVLLSPNRKLLASWEGEDWKPKQVERGIQILMK